jgi:hypothetical protein
VSRKPKPVPAGQKPLPLSEWVKAGPGKAVTRAQCINVANMMIQRQRVIDAMVADYNRWWKKLGRLIGSFLGLVKGPLSVTQEQHEAAIAAGEDPETSVIQIGGEAEPTDLEPVAEPEEPMQTTEEGVKFRDRRKGRG